MKRTYWHADATPIETTLDKVLYDIRRDDGTDGLIFDAVSLRDLEEAMDARLTLDAMLSPYNKLESKMSVLEQVMNRAGTAVKVTARQLSEPFTQNGTANVVALFELSDGQTVSIYFHNPDTTPKKILPTDEMISWKWLLNKKDITIVVAPEKGKDLNVRQVATRIMKLAETNSKGFQRANTKRAERMAEIDGLRTEISQLEGTLKGKLSQIEALKVEVEDAKIARESSQAFQHAGFTISPYRNGWKVQSIDNLEREAKGERQVGGDAVFVSKEDAIKEAELQAIRRDEQEKRRSALEAQNKAEADAEAKKISEFSEFVQHMGYSPPNARKAMEFLSGNIQNQGRIITRKQLIDERHQKNYRVIDRGNNEIIFQDRDSGTYLSQRDIGKTSIDYARFLESKAGISQSTIPQQGPLPWDEADSRDELKWLNTKIRIFAKDRNQASMGLMPEGEFIVHRVLNRGDLLEISRPGQESTFRVSKNDYVIELADPKEKQATTRPVDSMSSSVSAVTSGKLGLHVIKFPNGRFGYAGSVPDAIAYEPGATQEQIKNGKMFGSRFGPKTMSFSTEKEAVSYAAERGFIVNIPERPQQNQPPDESASADDTLNANKSTLLPKAPVEDYRVEPNQKGDLAWIKPPVGKSFTHEQKLSLASWFRDAGFDSRVSNSGVIFVVPINGKSIDDIPISDKAEARLAKSVAKYAAKIKAEDEKRANQESVQNTEAFKFVDNLLGDATNNYNKREMAQYLIGEKQKMDIDVGWKLLDRLKQAGVDVGDESPKALENAIKTAFTQRDTTEPSTQPTLSPEGRANNVKTAKGTKVETGFKLMEVDDLIVSHNADGSENPDYPQELQPRDRGRATSQAWVTKTANNLDPESLGRTSRADTGAPIVGPDGVVESGNGRSMAIREAYRLGKADEYKQWLEENADYFGVSPEKVKSMKKPVLVRIRTSAINRAEFAVEANQDDKLAMTATEKARADANRLTDELIAAMSEDGDLLAASNRGFINKFLQSLGDTESAQYITSSGQPTASLIARVQSAIFAKAYNDDRLLELTADSAKPEIANIISALNVAAPDFIRAMNLDRIATESTAEQLTDSIELAMKDKAIGAILGAINVVEQARRQQQDITEYVSQAGLFGDVDPNIAAMAIFIAQNNRSAKRMGMAFKAMAEFLGQEIERLKTEDVFGDNAPAEFSDLIKAANRKLQDEYGDNAGIRMVDMFGQNIPQRDVEPVPDPYRGTVPPPTPEMPDIEPPQKQADRSLFQSVIDGSIVTDDGQGILSPQVAELLEAAYYRNEGDPDMVSLFEQAVKAYQDAMIVATANIK